MHRVHVSDTAPGESGEESFVASHGVLHPLALQSEHRGEGAGSLPHFEHAAAYLDQRDAHQLLGTVPERGSCQPWKGVARPPRADGGLGRLLEL